MVKQRKRVSIIYSLAIALFGILSLLGAILAGFGFSGVTVFTLTVGGYKLETTSIGLVIFVVSAGITYFLLKNIPKDITILRHNLQA